MNFSLTSSKKFIPDDIRAAFKDIVQKEIAAQDPAQGVKLLKEPDQLEFNFTMSKKVFS
jgi:hypothetical protein